MNRLLIALALIFGLIAAEPLIVAGFQDLTANYSTVKTIDAQNKRGHLFPFHANHTATPQELSSHQVVFYYGDSHALCTATAIAPHALLTAGHCIEDAEDVDDITFAVDHVRTRYVVLGILVDHRDHIIILTNGPAFTRIAPYLIRAPKMGEETYIYGFGAGVYPAVKKVGKVINEYDPSEVDARAGIFFTNTQCIPGDSGSAVYGLDGDILGLLTYQVGGDHENEGLIETAGFQLGFTPEQISKALTFVEAAPKVAKVAPRLLQGHDGASKGEK